MLHDLVTKLRYALHASMAESLAVLLRDMRRAVDLLADPALDPTDRERVSQALAHAVFAILEEETDKSFVPEALKVLFSLDRTGAVLGLKYLRRRRMPAPEVEKILLSCARPTLLSLINDVFQAPMDLDPALETRLWKSFTSLANEDAELILGFLSGCAAQGRPLALPLQKTLVEGAFWMWMRRLLKDGLGPEQMAFVARGLAALGSGEVAAVLAARLEEGDLEVIRPLLSVLEGAGPTRDPRVLKPLAALLDHPGETTRLAALGVLIALKAPKAGLAWLKCRRMGKKALPALTLIALKLDGQELRALLAALPVEERRLLVLALFSALAGLAPGFLGRFTGAAAPGPGGQALEAFLRSHPPAPELERLFREPGPGDGEVLSRGLADVPVQGPKKTGFFARKAPEGPSLASLLEGDAPAGVNAPGQELVGRSFQGLSLRGAVLSRCRLSQVVFEDCSFVQTDLRGARLEGVTFRNCRFLHVTAGECEFLGGVLESCRLERCDFTRAKLRQTRLVDTLCDSVWFDFARMNTVRMERCLFAACNFWGAFLRGLHLMGNTFEAGDFSRSLWVSCRIQGLGLSGCRFVQAKGRGLALSGVTVQNCAFDGAAFFELETCDPDFLAVEARTLGLLLEEAGKRFEPLVPPPECLTSEAVSLAGRAVLEWTLLRETRERCQAVMAHNRRRLAWGAAKLGEEPARFLRLLPLALGADLSVPAQGAFAHVPCLVDGSQPTHGERRLLDRHLPGAVLAPAKGDGPRVLGVYTIGSFGSIAQTHSSDLDIWVCLAPGTFSGATADPFRAKLSWLERWADSAFGLEVHFFPMELEKVRANDFGLSDEEGAGSSLALLLKEEFYRTCVCLAGRIPAWWLTDPAASEAQTQAQVRRLENMAGFPRESAVDLGCLGQIPQEEFFGASLWQIVKALKSPFKSVMKLALMEKFMDRREEAGVLLCDHLKANLHRGMRDLWEVDPYALLFKEVNDHYHSRSDQETLRLLRLAFSLKAGIADTDLAFPQCNPAAGNCQGEYFYPSSSFRPTEKIKATQPDILSFSGRVEVGQKVAQFMAGAYQRISGLLGKGVEARITHQDLTKLGRRIMAHFAPRDLKVMRIPFMSSPKGLFRTLSFSVDAGQWVVRGQVKAQAGERAEAETVRKDHSPLRLMAWLIVNGIYTPGVYLQTDPALSPVSAEDVGALMRALYDFFPWKATFEPDMDEGLLPERVVKAFFAVNLRAPRQEGAIVELGLVYSTSWGELFCLPEAPNPGRAERAPLTLLKESIPNPVATGVVTTAFIPKRSNCPPIHFF